MTVPPVSPAIHEDDDRARARRIFQFEQDGRIWLDDTRLKASSRADATRRLTYLAVYAYELEGKGRMPRADLNSVLRDVDLFDSNSSKALNESDFVFNNDEIGLRATGREQAREYMRQVLDPNIADTWSVGSAMRSRGAKASDDASDATEGGKARKGRGRAPSQIVEKWVSEWRNLNLGIDGHRIVQQASSPDKGIIGLWAIRKATGDEVKHISRTQLAKFLYQAFVVKVADSTLGDALSSDAARDKVLRIKGSTFEITPTGMAYAEQLVGI